MNNNKNNNDFIKDMNNMIDNLYSQFDENHIEISSAFHNLDNDFKIFYDNSNNNIYIILLHFKLSNLDEIIKTENVIYAISSFNKKLQDKNNFYLKLTLNKKEKKYFQNAEKIHITDIFNFFNFNDNYIKSINFKGDGVYNNFAFDINFDMKKEFL